MAIEGVIDLDLNPTVSKSSISEVRRQLQDLAKAFSDDITKALDTAISRESRTGLRYGSRTRDYLSNIEHSATLYSETFKELQKSIKTESMAEGNTEQYNKQLTRVARELKQAMAIVSVVGGLGGTYRGLFEPLKDTEKIFQDISQGNINSSVGVGQAGLALERTNRLINQNRRNPFASDAFKSASYTGRNWALTTGNRARRGFRADEAAEYNAAAIGGVFDWMTANEGMNEALDLLGLQWKREGNHGPNLDASFYKTAKDFGYAVSNIGRVTGKLNDADVVGPERSYYYKEYKELRKLFDKGVKVLFADKKYRDAAVEAFESMAHIDKAVERNSAAMGALAPTAVLGALGRTVMAAYEARWQADISRSALGTREAQYGEVKSIGQSIGGVIGALLGGAAGTLIGQPLTGAAIGAAGMSAIGGIPGDYLQKRLEANKVSMDYVLAQHRNEAMYGTGYSTALAKAIQEQGIASSGDVTNMANNALTLRARMMLGMVGEQEMLMLSFMPEYFQKAMSGVQGAELINAYARSGRGIGDSSLRAFAMQNVMGGSQGMYALAMSPYFEHVMRAAGFYQETDAVNRMRMPGILDAMSTTKPIYNALYMAKEIMKTSRKEDPFIYTPGYARANARYTEGLEGLVDAMGGNDDFLIQERQRILNWATTPTNIYVYVDGEEISRTTINNGSTIVGGQYNVFKAGSN